MVIGGEVYRQVSVKAQEQKVKVQQAKSKKYDENAPTIQKIGKSKGNAPRDNKKQNKQTKDLKTKYGVAKKYREEIHNTISNQGYDYQELEEIIKEFKRKSNGKGVKRTKGKIVMKKVGRKKGKRKK